MRRRGGGLVVVDTQVFLRSIAPEGQYASVLDTLIDVCNSLVVSKPIINEYTRMAQAAGVTATLVATALEDKLGSRNKVRQAPTNPSARVPLEGIPRQDQPFASAA